VAVADSSIQATTHADRLFRPLIAVAVVLHLAVWLLPLAGPRWLAGFDVWLLRFDGYGALLQHGQILFWCLLASWLLAMAYWSPVRAEFEKQR
jgi:hypothetical protein